MSTDIRFWTHFASKLPTNLIRSNESTVWFTFALALCEPQNGKKKLQIHLFVFSILKSWLVVQNLKINFIRMFMSSKQLFVCHLSKKIVRIGRAGKGALFIEKKPSCGWLEKDQWESVISAQNFKLYTNSFYQQRARLELLMKVASRANTVDGKESGLGQKQTIYCHHNAEHRQDFVKDEVQWLNQKQENGN